MICRSKFPEKNGKCLNCDFEESFLSVGLLRLAVWKFIDTELFFRYNFYRQGSLSKEIPCLYFFRGDFMKPLIGVIPLWDEEKDSIWMLPGYMDGIRDAGGIPVILPFTADKAELAQLADVCSGFLFTGGQDVSPEIYGETPLNDTVECCRKRDDMEAALLKEAIEKNKPVLGICRGIQFINAFLGGSLYQDIPVQHPSAVNHHQQVPHDVPTHEVKVLTNTPLYDCLQTEKLSVNSYHHQAVKEAADRLEVMAVSEDGLVEGLYMPGHRFLWALQWHPEFSWKTDKNSRKIFQAFVEALTDGADV